MSLKLYGIISRVMSVPVSQVTDESGPENVPRWDSFNALVLVDELESEFNIKFTLNEITDVKNVADIKRHLRNHGVALDD